jgi:hypothetical protein
LRDESNRQKSNKKKYHKAVDRSTAGVVREQSHRRIDSKLYKITKRRSIVAASIAGVVREEEVAGIPTIEGRDIKPKKYSHKSRLYGSTEHYHKTTELTVRAIVLQTKLYGLNVSAKVTTARIPLDSCATTAVSQRQCLLLEEADTVAVAEEAEAQHQLLLSPHQSL